MARYEAARSAITKVDAIAAELNDPYLLAHDSAVGRYVPKVWKIIV